MFISPIFHPYIIKIKAIFQSFEFGKNEKIPNNPFYEIVYIFNCGLSDFCCLSSPPPFLDCLDFCDITRLRSTAFSLNRLWTLN